MINRNEEFQNWRMFKVSDATKYGLHEAIVMAELKVTDVESLSELREILPMFEEKQLKKIIKSLIKQGVIGNKVKNEA